MEDYIYKDKVASKRALAFNLYDQNSDGVICPIDMINNLSQMFTNDIVVAPYKHDKHSTEYPFLKQENMY